VAQLAGEWWGRLWWVRMGWGIEVYSPIVTLLVEGGPLHTQDIIEAGCSPLVVGLLFVVHVPHSRNVLLREMGLALSRIIRMG
jgi:hypothetical protein